MAESQEICLPTASQGSPPRQQEAFHQGYIFGLEEAFHLDDGKGHSCDANTTAIHLGLSAVL